MTFVVDGSLLCGGAPTAYLGGAVNPADLYKLSKGTLVCFISFFERII